MKTSILLISSLLALTTCNAKQRVTSPTVKVAPSLTFDSLSVTRSSDTDTLVFSILAVGSTDGHCPAAYSIMEHFSETAGGTFAGNTTADAKQMLDYYADSLHQELLHHPNLPYLRDGIKLFRSLEMTKMAETASYITMSISSESFDGGAHGMRTTEGFTVRKSDGRILGNEIFRPFKDEQQRDAWNIIVRQQLQKELNAATDEKLTQMLLIEDSLVPMPQSRIYLTPEGLHLVWQPYEIAPYAAGILHVTIPKETAMPYLNITGQRLLNSL